MKLRGKLPNFLHADPHCLKFPMFYLVTSDSLPIKAGKSLGNFLNFWNDEICCSKNKTRTSYLMNPAYKIQWKSLTSAAKLLLAQEGRMFCSFVANVSLFSDCIIFKHHSWMKNVLNSNFMFRPYFFISACMKINVENEKEDVVKFNVLSKCEQLVNDRCLERRIYVMKSVQRINVSLLPSQRNISFTVTPSRVALVSLS